jgi:hypothetical protein
MSCLGDPGTIGSPAGSASARQRHTVLIWGKHRSNSAGELGTFWANQI